MKQRHGGMLRGCEELRLFLHLPRSLIVSLGIAGCRHHLGPNQDI